MQISHVQYERRISDHDYGNRMMGASAILVEGEDAEEALDALREMVERKLNEEEEAARADRTIEREDIRLDNMIGHKTRQLADLEERWEKAAAFLQKAGVDVGDRYGDAPF